MSNRGGGGGRLCQSNLVTLGPSGTPFPVCCQVACPMICTDEVDKGVSRSTQLTEQQRGFSPLSLCNLC